ncbi:hypothetical protein [Xanthomonas arboricola]|uniref:hypothetical protein n=1 Tax=Xanthomonas arboricola TaxID=56448 RepID=UPI002B2E6DC3|nr:hypothetical protein X12_002557 [Xanthomonas arboricola]
MLVQVGADGAWIGSVLVLKATAMRRGVLMRKSCVIAADPMCFAEGDPSLDSENSGLKRPAGMTSAGFLCSILLLPLLRETFDALWAAEPNPK